jgi:hypothetical protein
MPRLSRAGSRGAAAPKKKRTPKTASAGNFYVAPTTPFIPLSRPTPFFSIKTSPGVPSPHLVDLREATTARPHGAPKSITKKENPGFAQVSVPRTISQNPDRARVWDQLALVAFARFVFAIAKGIVIGLGKLVILPLTAGLALYDRLDPDRREEPGAKNPTSPTLRGAGQSPIEVKPLQASDELSSPSQTEVSPRPTRNVPRAARQFKLRRALISFAGTSLAIILPLQGMNAFKAIKDIRARTQTARTASLGALNGTSSFSDAQAAIGAARQSVDSLGQVANALLERVPAVGDEFRSGKALLKAGDNLSTAAVLLSKSLDFINDKSLDLTAKIAKAQELAERSEPLLAAAQTALDSADQLPENMQGDIASLRSQVSTMDAMTRGFLELAPSLRNILGERESKRYLVLFQNNAELRPTGGFIGSFALVDVDRGEVKRVEVPAGGPYDLQGSLKTSVLAPEPIRLISAKWEFQDANWFPDFAASAKKLAWFYSQSGGPTVDGVIAINAPVLAGLLDAVGPISMPAYKTVATGTTVLATAQEIVESDTARESGKPKQFIADLLPLVLAKITSADGENALAAIKVFAQALEEKDIQISFSDDSAQAAFSKLGWTGTLAPVPDGFDSLELVRTNIAGGKTDTVIKTNIRHEAAVDADGSVTDHVTVTLEHQGKKGEKFTGVRNVSYVRLYVPLGSRLVKAAGDIRPPAYSFFDLPPAGAVPDATLAELTGVTLHDPNSGTAVGNEFGRTVFGVWTQTDPGQTTTLSFDYRLPFKITPSAPAPTFIQKIGIGTPEAPSAAFGLLIEKQSGAQNTEISSSLKLPAGWYTALTSPEGIADGSGWSMSSEIASDQAIGAVISK